MLISQTTPDEHPPTPPPCRWPALMKNFSSFGAASVMLCCSAPPACSSTPLRPSVHYPSIMLVANIVCIQTFCDHINVLYIFDQTGLYRFEVRLELYGANLASLLVLLPLLLTPRRHRQTMTSSHNFPPPRQSFSSFGAACVKLCCLPLPSLVRNNGLCCLIYV